jgi:hypothetical protein
MDFRKINSIDIEYRDANGNVSTYVEKRDKRKTDEAGDVMRITVQNGDASEETNKSELIFSKSETGEILVKGDFFTNESEIYKTTSPVYEQHNVCTFQIDDDDKDEMLIIFELLDAEKQIESPPALTTKGSAMAAKTYKNDFNYLTSALASKDIVYKDVDGLPRVYLKFLNGRTVQIEHADLMSDDDMASIFYIHECDHLDIKRYWTTVGSVIILNTAFKFSFPDKDGCMVDLVLRRCPDDEHVADEFCSDILTGMQIELESMLDDELKETMEKGFMHLEKLIKQGMSNTTSKPVSKRVSDQLISPMKKPRSKTV